MEKSKTQAQAERLLVEFGLLDALNQYGKAHVIGSCKMNLMAWNDLDIDVENDAVSLHSLHALTKCVLDRFSPVWLEVKQDVMAGKRCFFLGFETNVLGELWNVDIWFFDKAEIEACERYCEDVIQRTQNNDFLQDTIIQMKRELRARGMYTSVFSSMDVYDAVLNNKIYTAGEMISTYKSAKRQMEH